MNSRVRLNVRTVVKDAAEFEWSASMTQAFVDWSYKKQITVLTLKHFNTLNKTMWRCWKWCRGVNTVGAVLEMMWEVLSDKMNLTWLTWRRGAVRCFWNGTASRLAMTFCKGHIIIPDVYVCCSRLNVIAENDLWRMTAFSAPINNMD